MPRRDAHTTRGPLAGGTGYLAAFGGMLSRPAPATAPVARTPETIAAAKDVLRHWAPQIAARLRRGELTYAHCPLGRDTVTLSRRDPTAAPGDETCVEVLFWPQRNATEREVLRAIEEWDSAVEAP